MSYLSDTRQVRVMLSRAGYRSIAEWARAHGFRPGTVWRVLQTWGGRAGCEPHGGTARQVMRALRETIFQTED